MKIIDVIVRKDQWPILHYAMAVALPYFFIALLFGFFYRWEMLPELGDFGGILMFFFSPIAGQVVSYTGSTPWEAVSLAFNLIITLFFTWLFMAPLVGLVRAIINI